MTTKELRHRAEIALACLPDAPFRKVLGQLFDDMLAAPSTSHADFALRYAVDALLSNEEHAVSGGMRSYAEGSQTWEIWEAVRVAVAAAPSASPEPNDDFDTRGVLAKSLKCWHRLTGIEAQELVDFVRAVEAKIKDAAVEADIDAAPATGEDLSIYQSIAAGYHAACAKQAAPSTSAENFDAEANVRLDAELQRCMKEHDALRAELAALKAAPSTSPLTDDQMWS